MSSLTSFLPPLWAALNNWSGLYNCHLPAKAADAIVFGDMTT